MNYSRHGDPICPKCNIAFAGDGYDHSMRSHPNSIPEAFANPTGKNQYSKGGRTGRGMVAPGKMSVLQARRSLGKMDSKQEGKDYTSMLATGGGKKVKQMLTRIKAGYSPYG